MAKHKAVRQKWSVFEAEAAYTDSIFRSAIGDSAGCIRALERTIEIKPSYAPAVLSMGSVEYQCKPRLREESFCFLSWQCRMTSSTLQRSSTELYRAPARTFPEVAIIHQGRGCCAGHTGELEEAIAASRRALELEPDNQK